MTLKPRAVVVALCLLPLAGCFFPKAGTAPGPLSASALESAQTRWPELSGESLEKGRQLYLASCNGCHAYPDMGHYTEEQWPAIMTRMGGKSGFSQEDSELVLRFVLAAREEAQASR